MCMCAFYWLLQYIIITSYRYNIMWRLNQRRWSLRFKDIVHFDGIYSDVRCVCSVCVGCMYENQIVYIILL